MAIRRVLRANRFTCLLLTVAFYLFLFVCFIQLAYLDSSQGVEPVPRYIPDKALGFPRHMSDRNTASDDTMNNNSIQTVSTSETLANSALEYVDWNDYELMAKDAQNRGQGEQGTAFTQILTPEEQKLSEELFKKYKFNAFASDRISLERSVTDLRLGRCKTKQYLKNITTTNVSIIVIFHNEKNSTIFRLLHSIVNRSPARLVKEIVLIDDLSSDEELKQPLENYIHQHFSNVKLIRNRQREGLIRTRMIGANESTGDILLFLDAHMELNYNYLPPLVEPILLDYKKIVCPMTDIIQDDTLKIRPTLNWERGAFSWDLVFRRLPVFDTDETANRPIAAMLGAAFAISRKWWEEIGRYDPGLEIWGGEQYEITFKSWMCGGSVIDVPCSRVAHLFRQIPYVDEILKNNLIERNYLRVAKVWMDEYIEYVFQRRPFMRTIEPGDLTDQFALRKRLNCKSFKWYLTEVAPDIPTYFPLIEPPFKAWGMLRSNLNSSLCVNINNGWLFLGNCQENDTDIYIYDWKQHISFTKYCLSNTELVDVYMYQCYSYEKVPTQEFVWDPATGRIVNRASKYCMDINIQIFHIVMAPCNISKATQSWRFDAFNSTLVDEAQDKYRAELDG